MSIHILCICRIKLSMSDCEAILDHYFLVDPAVINDLPLWPISCSLYFIDSDYAVLNLIPRIINSFWECGYTRRIKIPSVKSNITLFSLSKDRVSENILFWMMIMISLVNKYLYHKSGLWIDLKIIIQAFGAPESGRSTGHDEGQGILATLNYRWSCLIFWK